MKNILHINEFAESEQKSLVRILFSYLDNCINTIDQLKNEHDKLKEQINQHKDEINILKAKKQPKFKPSKLDKLTTTTLNKCKNTKK